MGVLNHLKIKLKLALLLGLSALALVAAILMSAEIIHQRMMTDRLDKLHAVVEVAIGTAHWLQKDVDAGKMTQDQAIERFGAFIADMGYDNHQDYLLVAGMLAASFEERVRSIVDAV